MYENKVKKVTSVGSWKLTPTRHFFFFYFPTVFLHNAKHFVFSFSANNEKPVQKLNIIKTVQDSIASFKNYLTVGRNERKNYK